MKRCHTEHVVLGQVHIPLCVVGIGHVIYSIATVVRTTHPDLWMLLTKTVVGFVKTVVVSETQYASLKSALTRTM